MIPHYSSQTPISPQCSDAGGTDWRESAACRDLPVDLHHPPGGGGGAGAWDEARAVCAVCPVVAECRAEADRVETPSTTWGMWGAETPDERLRRRKNAVRGGGAA